MDDKNKSHVVQPTTVPVIAGTRLEGTLLNTPSLRTEPKSNFLKKLEKQQAKEQKAKEEEGVHVEPSNVTPIKAKVKSVK